MEPTSAAQRLAALGNSINSGAGLPQYTPPSTPIATTPAPVPAPVYTPPVLTQNGPAAPAQTLAPQHMPQPAPQPIFQPTPQLSPLGAPIPQRPIAVRPVVQAMTPNIGAPQPVSAPAPLSPTPLAIPAGLPTSSTTPAAPMYRDPATVMPASPQSAPRSRRFTLWLTTFAATFILTTGLLYWYGSVALRTGGGAPQNTQPAVVPENGFQVTESSVYEPNFDQSSPSTSPSGINTDPAAMFDDSALPPSLSQ